MPPRWGGLLALAALLAAAAAGVALALLPSDPGGIPADASPHGHALLVEALARERPVRIVASSLALVPPDPDGVLFAFATGLPTAREEEAVRAFLEAGGLVVVAGDGGGVRAWVEPFGVPPLGLAAGAQGERACTPANFTWGGARAEACLPNPSAFPQTEEGNHTLRGVATAPLAFDLNADGRLDLGDQAPDAYPLALGWRVGAGNLVAIADGELWGNAAARQWPQNLALAQRLAADRTGTAYLDATGSAPQQAGALRDGLLRSAAALDPAFPVVAGVAAAGAGLLALAPRLRPWRRHAPPADASDPAAEQALAQTIHAFFQDQPEAR